MQASRIDAELARLFEDYYQQSYRPIDHSAAADPPRDPGQARAYGRGWSPVPSRAWPTSSCKRRRGASPTASAASSRRSGHGCDHPLDVCMIFSDVPGFFDQRQGMRALTQAEALATLQRAADAGTGAFDDQQPEGRVVSSATAARAPAAFCACVRTGHGATSLRPRPLCARWMKISARVAATVKNAVHSGR